MAVSVNPLKLNLTGVGELIREKLGLPFLHVVTDYSQSDTEQLRGSCRRVHGADRREKSGMKSIIKTPQIFDPERGIVNHPSSAGTFRCRHHQPMREKSMSFIDAVQVSKTFNGNKNGSATLAVSDITLNVREKEFIAIIGPSGCGKSTFLLMVAGLESVSSGQLTIEGQPVTGPDYQRAIVFQEFLLFPWKTVKANIEFGPMLNKMKKSDYETVSQDLIRLVGLEGFEKRFPHELSGGMKQRVAIARALANHPKGAAYGRTLRRTGRPHPGEHADGTSEDLGEGRLHRSIRDPLHYGSDFSGGPSGDHEQTSRIRQKMCSHKA